MHEALSQLEGIRWNATANGQGARDRRRMVDSGIVQMVLEEYMVGGLRQKAVVVTYQYM